MRIINKFLIFKEHRL